MSETADPIADEAQATLRDALALIRPPQINGEPVDPDAFRAELEGVLADAWRAAEVAKAPANSTEATMVRALTLSVEAGDAASALGALKNMLGLLEQQCQDMTKAAEQALCDAMRATRTPEVESDTHVAKPKRPTQKVVITERDKLPPDVFVQPKPKDPEPSIELCRAKLITGQVCEGAELVDSPPAINVTARKVRRG